MAKEVTGDEGTVMREFAFEQTLNRSVSVVASDVDTEGRRVKLSFASEKPVERWDWNGPYDEILRMTPEAVDLGRMNDAGALLSDHNHEKQIGVVERAWVGDDKRAHAIVRFSERPDAEHEFKDVIAGIRRNVSFGYRIHEFDHVRGEKGQKDTVTSTRTEVLEISLVSVPADKSIGVGRSEPTKVVPEPKPDEQKLEKKEGVVTFMENEQQTVNEFAREDAILGFAKRFNVEERVAQTFAADKSKTVDDLRAFVQDNLRAMSEKAETTSAQPAADLDLSPKDVKRYSISRAIMGQIDPSFAKTAGFERECHEAILERGLKTQAGGFFVPADILYAGKDGKRVDLSAGGGLTTGGALIGTDHMPESFIELLRNNMKMRELGMTIMSGLVGTPSIPRQDTAGTVYWVAEGVAPTESNLTVGQLQLTPKTVGAVQEFTRQLLIQSSPSVDTLVQSDIAAIMARGIDLAAINGLGASNQPLGLLNTTGVEEVAQSGTVFSWEDVVAFRTALKSDNALLGTPAWLTNAGVEGALATIQKTPTAPTGQYLLSENGRMNGYALHTSEQVPVDTLIFGDFSQVIMGEWGVLEIVANDRGTTFRTGNIEVRALHMVDIQVRYPQALKKLEAFVGVEPESSSS